MYGKKIAMMRKPYRFFLYERVDISNILLYIRYNCSYSHVC